MRFISAVAPFVNILTVNYSNTVAGFHLRGAGGGAFAPLGELLPP